jgi:hypothetical protein
VRPAYNASMTARAQELLRQALAPPQTVSLVVRFEDDADTEYRGAGRWYEAKQAGLGVQFFDELDAAIRRVLPRGD